jgi:hypothetical protein
MIINMYNPSTQGLIGDALPFDAAETSSAARYNKALECIETALHGRLDDDNWAAGPIVARHTQRGALVDGWSVGGTAALDYHAPLFGAVLDTDTMAGGGYGEGLRQQYAIPGGSRSVYVPSPSLALITWNIHSICDGFYGSSTAIESVIGLVVDDVYLQRRKTPATLRPDLVAKAFNLYGYNRQRCWGGAALVALDAGVHDVSLQVLADYRVRMTRIRTRSLQVTLFKEG